MLPLTLDTLWSLTRTFADGDASASEGSHKTTVGPERCTPRTASCSAHATTPRTVGAAVDVRRTTGVPRVPQRARPAAFVPRHHARDVCAVACSRVRRKASIVALLSGTACHDFRFLFLYSLSVPFFARRHPIVRSCTVYHYLDLYISRMQDTERSKLYRPRPLLYLAHRRHERMSTNPESPKPLQISMDTSSPQATQNRDHKRPKQVQTHNPAAHSRASASASSGRKLHISTCVLPARLHMIAHVDAVYATFHTLSHGSLISRTYSYSPPAACAPSPTAPPSPPMPPPAPMPMPIPPRPPAPRCRPRTCAARSVACGSEDDEDGCRRNSKRRTRPSLPPVTRKRASNWRPVTLLSCAARRCTTLNGRARAGGGPALALALDEGARDEEMDDDDAAGERRGGEGGADEGRSEKMMTRPSEPPVTSMLCESCTWQTRAVWPWRSAEQTLGCHSQHLPEGLQVTQACVPCLGVPHPDGGVHAAAHYTQSVERDGVDLVVVSTQDVQALARVDVPEPASEVVAATRNLVAADIDTPYAVFVTFQHPQALAALDVPDTQCAVSRAGNGDRTVMQNFQTADGRCVPLQYIDTEAGTKSGYIRWA